MPVYGSNGQVGWHDKSLVKGPGIVVGRKGNVGSVTWVQIDFFPIDTTFYVVPRINPNSMHFLFHTLSWLNLSNLTSDSAVPGLNRDIAQRTRILVPPVKVLSIFERLSGTLTFKLYMNNKQKQILESLRNTLLPRLISGKIRVQMVHDMQKVIAESDVEENVLAILESLGYSILRGDNEDFFPGGRLTEPIKGDLTIMVNSLVADHSLIDVNDRENILLDIIAVDYL